MLTFKEFKSALISAGMNKVTKNNEELVREKSIPELTLLMVLVGANSAKDFMIGISDFIRNLTGSEESVYEILYDFYKRNHRKED